MGCTASRTKLRIPSVNTPTEQERLIMDKLEQLARQIPGMVSPQEMELIRQTFYSLQDIDISRRNK